MMQQGQGLSTMGAQDAPDMQQDTGVQAPANQQGITIDDVIKALMQGATPEQLLQAGVPKEMIQQAIQILQQQAQQQGQGGQPQQPQGLSQVGMQQGIN